ncbi:MAG: hypothetical protein ACLRHS_09160 [Roseburia inulinivorans]|uniref:hypothetical protein n=1 Tax=Roseburia inulinivorans TaxID=360807 RepID=UPI0012E2E691|nr:hypothetical protein [Roseburia inulinivorans]MBS5096392.1 hypothetical protein [Roseburia sp.]
MLELIMRKIPSSIHASWKSLKNKQEKESSKFQNGGIYCFFAFKEFKNIRRLSNCSGDNLFVALISSICFLLIRVEEDTIKFFD